MRRQALLCRRTKPRPANRYATANSDAIFEMVGERHLKVMVEPVGGGPLLDGIAFNVDTALWPDNGVRETR